MNKVFQYISKINRDAYNDIYLLSNQVLSKNPHTNGFINHCLNNKSDFSISLRQIILKIIIYYLKSIILLIKYLSEKFIYNVFFMKKVSVNNCNELIVIDTFFLINRIIKEKKYSDPYFPGLEKILNNGKKNFVYLPVFIGNSSLYLFIKTLNILKKQKVPLITEYQLLNKKNILELIKFIIKYPLHILKFAYGLDSNEYYNKILKFELFNTIDKVTFYNFSRYLQGEQLSKFHYDKVKLISWYENQVIDKNLYKGLRKDRNKITIYGCQLFIISPTLISINVDPNEIKHDIVPDKILVNGKNYLYNDKKINSFVGPSLRYKKLFEIKLNYRKTTDLLIPFSYHKDANEIILNILKDINYQHGKIIVKFHPATQAEEYMNKLPGDIFVSDENIYELFERTKILMSIESGTLLEAASLGIPVIAIPSSKLFIDNPMPSYGKGEIWDSAKNFSEANGLINKYTEIYNNEIDIFAKFAKDYKEMFFCEPTEESIVKAFDLS